MDDNICKDCFWEFHGVCNYPWDCSETEIPNVLPHCIAVVDDVDKDSD